MKAKARPRIDLHLLAVVGVVLGVSYVAGSWPGAYYDDFSPVLAWPDPARTVFWAYILAQGAVLAAISALSLVWPLPRISRARGLKGYALHAVAIFAGQEIYILVLMLVFSGPFLGVAAWFSLSSVINALIIAGLMGRKAECQYRGP